MRRRSWLAILAILAMTVAACGGAAAPEADGGDGGGAGSAPPAATPTDGAGTGTGPADAPVTVTLDGVTFGFPVGTCDVTDDLVRANAGPVEGEFGGVDIDWRRDGSAGSFSVVNSGLVSGPPAPFELHADAVRSETTWDVRVDGTTATIDARMANELPAAQGDPAVAFYDVTIRIACAERGFGGMAPAPTDAEAPPAEPEPATAATEATVTVSLGETTYTFPYLGCPMDEPAISMILVDADFTRLLVTVGEAIVALPDGTSYRSQGEVAFDVSGRSATWTGTMTTGTADVSTTIEIACGG